MLQHFSDEFGWPELAAQIGQIWNALPLETRAKTIIFARTTARPAQSISSDHAGACRAPTAGTKTIFPGNLQHLIPQTSLYWASSTLSDWTASLHKSKGSGTSKTATHWSKFDIFFCRRIKFSLRSYWPA